jgi:hypothetical protein
MPSKLPKLYCGIISEGLVKKQKYLKGGLVSKQAANYEVEGKITIQNKPMRQE